MSRGSCGSCGGNGLRDGGDITRCGAAEHMVLLVTNTTELPFQPRSSVNMSCELEQ